MDVSVCPWKLNGKYRLSEKIEPLKNSHCTVLPETEHLSHLYNVFHWFFVHRYLMLSLQNSPVSHLSVNKAQAVSYCNVILSPCPQACSALKALCHAIRAGCVLIEAAYAHVVNEQWAWRMADKFTCTFKPAHWGLLCWVFDFPGIL